MYPAMMLKYEMPVGKIRKFEGNPLKTGESFKSLSDQHAFIKCTIEVDKSLNRPVYMTKALINGEIRSVCATGTFLNQWVYVKFVNTMNLLMGKLELIQIQLKRVILSTQKIYLKIISLIYL
jgi:hypothetical protein